MNVAEKLTYRGFNKGYEQLTLKDKKEAIQRLWDALGINNRNTFYVYRMGKIEPKISQANAIQEVFNSYGITEIWD